MHRALPGNGALHVLDLVEQGVGGAAAPQRLLTAVLGVGDNGLLPAGVVVEFDIALVKGDRAALGLLSVQRENDRRHLLLLVFQKDARLLVHACGGKPHLGDDLVRCGGHEPPHEGQRVDADIQQCAACEIAVEEAVGHIIGLVTAKIHLDKPQLA